MAQGITITFSVTFEELRDDLCITQDKDYWIAQHAPCGTELNMHMEDKVAKCHR